MTGEIFSSFVRRLTVAFLLLLLVALAGQAHAQNAGVVGIATKEITVFTAQTSSASSGGTWQCNGSTTPIACPVLPDAGFGANYLSFSTTAFTGTIDLEWNPTYGPNSTTGPWFVLSKATYSNDTTATGAQHLLQLGGYFPNLRVTLTMSAGTISAWYTANAAPIQYTPPAIGSNGPTSPIQCDQFVTATAITSGSGVSLASSATRGFAICGFTISFLAATTTATTGVEVGFGPSSACPSSGGLYPWFIATTSSTPQVLTVGGGLGTMFQVAVPNSGICVSNNSGSTLEISLWYALL